MTRSILALASVLFVQATLGQVVIMEIPEDAGQVGEEQEAVRGPVLPYSEDPDKQLSTLGQLCKQSQLIVFGIVTNSWIVGAEGLSKEPAQVLDVKVREVLFGDVAGQSVRLYIRPPMEEPARTPFSATIFASAKGVSVDGGELSWKFNFAKAKGREFGRMEVVCGVRGLISEEKDIGIRAPVRGYIAQLRSGNQPDPSAYGLFLQTLMPASDARIRKDAEVDMFLLLRTMDKDQRRALIPKLASTEKIRNYAKRLDDRDEAEMRRAERLAEPSASEQGEILALLAAGERADIVAGLGRAGEYRGWLRTPSTELRRALLSLLDHRDKGVRFSAAEFLAESKDAASLPILLEALGDASLAERTIAWAYLERLVEASVKFDPRATPEERAAVIGMLRATILKQ